VNSTAPASAPAEAAGPAAPAGPSVAQREVWTTSYLVVGALLVGMVLQVWIPPGGITLVAAAFLASLVVVALGYIVPGRLRQTIAGFRFISTLLFVLAVMAVLGTLVLQMKPAAFYISRYGAAGKLIVALRLDDIFHGLPFALVMALFGASIIASATTRWPLKLKAAGFFVCHVGLMTSLAGAAASATLAIRGRIDLHAGGDQATHVRVTHAGMPTGEVSALGFDLHLDRFEAPSYEAEYRLGYYEQVTVDDEHGVHQEWRLKASFDPDLEKHRLPNGDSFQLKGVYPDLRPNPDGTPRHVAYSTTAEEWKNAANPAVQLEVNQMGVAKEQLLFAKRPPPFFLSATSALVFERRADEKRAYISWVTARQGASETKAVISVNEPMTHNGWTLYQVNYNPNDPTYSGLEAVYDPGVFWVFTGFALICLGVFWMFYVEPRMKKATKDTAHAKPAAAQA
jgi:ResB-like family